MILGGPNGLRVAMIPGIAQGKELEYRWRNSAVQPHFAHQAIHQGRLLAPYTL